jgi:protocatechuate 3,4-dioxygenase beta subunit
MKTPILILFSFLFFNASLAQGTLVGGACQGCEAVFEYDDRTLSATDTLPGFEENTPKLKITGTIYEPDGKTPASDVILYIYHTNHEGVYPTDGDEQGWARRHGYIRGWVKTGADGKYTFYTFKPGSYSSNPAHIHPTILEPNGQYYWLGSYHFSGDPHLTEEHKNSESPRGGSNGILSLKKETGMWVGHRDFILGKNLE